MSNKMTISFGDNVKIRKSQETDQLGLSGKFGQVSGVTTPSATDVDVIGQTKEGFALNVTIESEGTQYWFAPHLLEFVDHAEGTTLQVGNIRAIRQADGSWQETVITPKKKWWHFWK
jgi:hypothetical protein